MSNNFSQVCHTHFNKFRLPCHFHIRQFLYGVQNCKDSVEIKPASRKLEVQYHERSNKLMCHPFSKYHLAIFFKPASRACFIGIYLSSLQRVSHSDWSRSRRGKTLWQVGVVCAKSSSWVSARIYQYNLSTAELKTLSSFIPWGSLEQDLLFSIWRKTACN